MCTNDEIDARLKQLAVAAKNYQPKTLERQLAVTNLIKEIHKHHIVGNPKNPNFPRQTYQEICAEAKQDLMLRICKEIHNYRPEKEVRQWVNFLMDKCFKAATPKVIGSAPIDRLGFLLETTSVSDDFADSDSQKPDGYIKILCFADMDRWSEPEEDDCYELGTALREMIEADAGDAFKGEVMKRHPHINFQVLLLKRLDDVGWQKISEEFGVKVPSLSSFFQRRLQKFRRRFTKYL